MLENNGKLMVYTSQRSNINRLKVVNSAVSRVANSLNLDIEKSLKRKLLSIYVYYRTEIGEEIPLYCDWGKHWGEEDVCQAIKSVMFVLSFHPHHSSLRAIRSEICSSA